MRPKQLIKSLVPPLLIDLIRKTHPKFTWEGVYQYRCDVPIEGGGYDDDRRIHDLVEDARGALELVTKNCFPGFPKHKSLGLLASVLCANKGGVRILDFGGGAGTGFVQLIAMLRNNVEIQYHVVDFEKTCAAGRQFFGNDQRIQFHSSLPRFQNSLDIVYASSVLPYIDDYTELLQRLAALNAPYLLLSDLAAGNFSTYAARQLNLPGQVLAYWFLNLEEVIRIVEACGYSCIYSGRCGKEYDQSNFPETYRIGQMRDLLFFRNSQKLKP